MNILIGILGYILGFASCILFVRILVAKKRNDEIINKAKQIKGMPTAIIAKTIKGKGVSFMEDNVGWHGKAPNEEEYKLALTELGGEADE